MKDYLIYGAFGYLSDEVITRNTRYVYFIRLTERGIPIFDHKEDSIAEMPQYFLVGSVSGRVLQGMQHLMKQVWKPCLYIISIDKLSNVCSMK